MIRGIGIDTVSISEIQRYLENKNLCDAYLRHTFTDAEQKAAQGRCNLAEYYATRFAVKEAVFKAIGHLLPEKHFDLRLVETLNASDGCPYIRITPALSQIIHAAGVTHLHVSITTEDNYATAFVIAEQ